jgi:hypothetical protein
MPRLVQVEVGRNGQVKMDFSGFEGETCYDEADALQRALKELGLWAIPLTVTPKPSAQTAEEVGERKSAEKKVPLA